MATAKKRTLIEPNKGDKRYVRRNDKGEFNESDDVGRSLAADVRQKAKTAAKPGQGDRGDRQEPAAKAGAAKKGRSTSGGTGAKKSSGGTGAKKSGGTGAKKSSAGTGAKKSGAKKSGAKTSSTASAGRKTSAKTAAKTPAAKKK